MESEYEITVLDIDVSEIEKKLEQYYVLFIINEHLRKGKNFFVRQYAKPLSFRRV